MARKDKKRPTDSAANNAAEGVERRKAAHCSEHAAYAADCRMCRASEMARKYPLRLPDTWDSAWMWRFRE